MLVSYIGLADTEQKDGRKRLRFFNGWPRPPVFLCVAIRADNFGPNTSNRTRQAENIEQVISDKE
jgi:hypothetical protein